MGAGNHPGIRHKMLLPEIGAEGWKINPIEVQFSGIENIVKIWMSQVEGGLWILPPSNFHLPAPSVK